MLISRRSALAGGLCALAAPVINRGRFQLFAGSSSEYSTRTVDLVRESTVIDMLGLLTLDYLKLFNWQAKGENFPAEEFDRLKASGVTILHPAVGFTSGDIYSSSLNDLTRWNLFLAAHADRFMRIDGPADADMVKALGKIGVILGLQNSEHFRTLADVDFFYKMGQRVSQLTYNTNALGGGSTDSARGLTDYGATVVERMNQLGMAIDVSHCADRTTLDAIALSRKPVLITHSNSRKLVPNSVRCKPDDAIGKMAAKGGVLGVTMVRYFVRSGGRTTIEDVLDHINHVATVSGIEHVGLGTDVDLIGRDVVPSNRKQDLDGISYAQKIFDVTEGLLRRNFTSTHIQMILGGNFRRALSDIWTSKITH